MDWTSFKSKFAYQIYFSYTLPDTHEQMIETLCKDQFETPLHYKQSNIRFQGASLKKLLKKDSNIIHDLQNVHDFGDQILRMNYQEIKKQVPYFLI
ncbi:unnamed protein product [Paramecium primaurelia]|uniref:Uncharacterized protein n=2 Tax=Paramecium TaxID=5884 RepID=A0A8S1SDG8_9CILI|nr:unnamed protein product [Paramecium primaurelia]CAD8136734.1 unnamed protein product [Paramecium pentaurelia]